MSEWKLRAACRDCGGDTWFPSGFGDARRSRAKAVRSAVAICKASCPVRAECAADALKSGVRVGIWGGVDLGDTATAVPSANKLAALTHVAGGGE